MKVLVAHFQFYLISQTYFLLDDAWMRTISWSGSDDLPKLNNSYMRLSGRQHSVFIGLIDLIRGNILEHKGTLNPDD